MIATPPINILLAHPTNMWPRYDTNFEFIVLHYVGAVYESTIDGNVWSPEAYPAGWRAV